MTKIKICGIKTLDEVAMMNELDVDYVGFVFAKSKRQIDVTCAKEMKKHLSKEIKTVGVFMNQPANEILKITQEIPLDIIQIHGNCQVEVLKDTFKHIWQAVSIHDEKDIMKLKEIPTDIMPLCDGRKPGSGEAFNWDLLKDHMNEKAFVLAGGLTEKNVEEAIKTLNPTVVDVSSGVEGSSGKDKRLVKAFIRRVKNV